MKKFRWQIAIILLTGLVVGILLIFEQPKTGTGSFNAAPSQGGSYTEAMIGQFQRLNPLFDTTNQADREIDQLLYSGLVKFDDRGVPQYDLTESMGISQDGSTYTFLLRQAQWHDGAPVTADDVVFTIDLIRSDASAYPDDIKKFWQSTEIFVLDQRTIQFKLPEPFAPFMDYLTFGLLPRHLLDGKGYEQIVDDPFNLQPIGTGPFVFDKFLTRGEEIIGVQLKANTSFYGAKPFLEEIIFMYYSDTEQALKAFRDGTVQGISYIPTQQLSTALLEPNLSIYTSRLPQVSMVLFNLADPKLEFLQEKPIRRALYMGINRDMIVNNLLQGQAIKANGPILPGTWAYYPGTPSMSYDPAQAQLMLKEAGFVIPSEGGSVRMKEGVALSFTLLHPDDETHQRIAELIQKNWQTLGVEVTLEAVSYEDLITNHLETRDYQAALVDLNLSHSPDPDPYPFWDQAQASGGQNYTQWENRVASEYLESARITTDLDERARIYRNFQVVFSDEVPALPLYNPVFSFGVSNKIKGVSVGPIFDRSDRFNQVTSWHLVSTLADQPATPVNSTP